MAGWRTAPAAVVTIAVVVAVAMHTLPIIHAHQPAGTCGVLVKPSDDRVVVADALAASTGPIVPEAPAATAGTGDRHPRAPRPARGVTPLQL